jgi:hypothetical protein
MTARTWLVNLACPRCGAPGRFIDAQLIAICEFCGHVISTHRAVTAGVESYAFAEVRSYLLPTLADVRRLELADRKLVALEARDPETLHAATLELAALDAIDAHLSPADLATFARWTAAIEHVATFDCRTAMITPQHEALARDPAGYTTQILEQLTRAYRDLVADERFPADLVHAIPPEVAAVDALLGCLTSWVLDVPLAAFDLALTTLGHRPIRIHGAPLPCRTCGAPICAEALATLLCTYCRSPLEVRRHVWLAGLLRTVALANGDKLVQRDRAYAVAVMLTHVAKVAGNSPLPEHLVVAYLEGVEGVERAAVDEITAFMLQHHGLDREATAAVHAIRALLDHLPAAIPPPPGRRAGAFIALEPSEAWRRAMLRNWRRVLRYATLPPDQRGLVAVNQLLPPLAGGYLPDPDDAASFLRSIGEPLAPIRAALALHRSAEHTPEKRAFWDATARRLD